MSDTSIYVWGELVALQLLTFGSTTTNPADGQNNPHQAGDQIILLAEKIKAARAVSAMAAGGGMFKSNVVNFCECGHDEQAHVGSFLGSCLYDTCECVQFEPVEDGKRLEESL